MRVFDRSITVAFTVLHSQNKKKKKKEIDVKRLIPKISEEFSIVIT